MALTFSSLGGSTTGFAIDTGDGTKTDVTLAKEYPAGGYQISSANNNQGLFIFFGASDGTPAGGTSSKSIVASKAFNKLTIIGVTANDLITFTYKETATLNAVGTSSSYSGAVVTSFSPNQISNTNDTLILNGAALGTNVTVKFTGANNTPLNAKSITRVSDTQLIVTRPDTMPGDQDPYKITVQNPGIEPAVSTSTVSQPLYAGLAPVWSTAATLPAFSKNVSYTQQLIASDPDGTAITYSFVNGSLPAGLTYAANSSTISGTPTGSTSASFTVRATETSGRYTDRTFTLPDAYPVFTTSPTLSAYTKNVSYSTTIIASDDSGVTPSLSLVGTMPTGLSFNALTGAVTGTMGFTTNQTFTIRATDANGSTTDQTFTIPNTGPSWVTSATLPAYTKNVSYSTQLSGTDDGTVTYSLASGTLPSGITLSSSGLISGTSTVTTNHSPVIRLQDDAGNYVNRTFTLNNVGANAPVWTTASGALTATGQGNSYSLQLVATDDSGAAPTYSIASGSLPTGLTLSSSGLISGTCTGSGTFSFTVNATDANGTSTAQSFSIFSAASGGTLYSTPGTYTFTVPSAVSSINVVAVGAGGGGGGFNSGGGGGGGGLGWKNNIAVSPGQTYTVVVGSGGGGTAGGNGSSGGNSYFNNTSTVLGIGGNGGVTSTGGSGGSYTGDGGGTGGAGGDDPWNCGGAGGGGAAGYSGSGGKGATNSSGTAGSANYSFPSSASGGGAAGGGANASSNASAAGGGGVGMYGQGASGVNGTAAASLYAYGGQGGSGGSNGVDNNSGITDTVGYPGGARGGGGGGANQSYAGGSGANGGVRIIWGTNRSFPSTNTTQNFGGVSETVI